MEVSEAVPKNNPIALTVSRATYVDGALAAPDGAPVDPKACAGNDGTTITVNALPTEFHYA